MDLELASEHAKRSVGHGEALPTMQPSSTNQRGAKATWRVITQRALRCRVPRCGKKQAIIREAARTAA